MLEEQTPLLGSAGGLLPYGGSKLTAALPPAPARLPQNIGHRGYSAAFPENSMAAFQGAVAAGADAIETDLHLSRDGVVVLSHDATLKRCFGIDRKIADCDWAYLRTLKTVRQPGQGMPRLADLLVWLARPGLEAVWVLLDIKTDDDPDALLAAIAATIASVPAVPSRPWKARIVLGAWNEPTLSLALHHLPSHPRAYIGLSPLPARRFLEDDSSPGVDFNLFQPSLVGPVGACFRRAVRAARRRLYAWTVDDEAWMEWCVRKGVDGVVTDDPEAFGRVRERFAGERGVVDGDGERTDAAARGRWGRHVRFGWLRTARRYAAALVLQAASAVLVLLRWKRLRAKQGGVGKGQDQPDPLKA